MENGENLTPLEHSAQSVLRHQSFRRFLCVCACLSSCLTWSLPSYAADKVDPQLAGKAHEAVDKALAFLAAAQREDGGWELFGKSDPAITALVAKCFADHPRHGPEHPIVRRALAYVLTFQKPDGGIYVEDGGLHSYYTSVALMALAVTKDEKSAPAIKRAQDYLIKIQWDEDDGHDPQSAWYGGAGYGKSKRPDLSNTQMMLEALKDSGLPPAHPAYQKAMAFIARCQMASHTNDREFARGADDGGFIYTAVGEGESKAGTVEIGGKPRLRSYGSMTYAGFKSMLYANVDKNDPRVQAAFDWIRKHYTLDSNPNMPQKQSHEGLYYFYHVFSRALSAWGQDEITDAGGAKHNWHEDLCKKLLSLQATDGSWVNDADRWYEGNPYLVTAYSVLALQTALR